MKKWLLITALLMGGCAAFEAPAPETRQARQERLLRGLRALRENPTWYINLEIARETQAEAQAETKAKDVTR